MTPVQLPEVPAPAFELRYRHGTYYVTEPNIGLTECYTAAQLRAYATEAVMAERARLFAIGDDPRVHVDTFYAVVDSARSYMGAGRPDDEDPEDQWMWDKLTALLEILTQPEQNSGR